jgi:hypothetical protein
MKSAAPLLILGSSLLPRANADLKPPYQEIYQTTTVVTHSVITGATYTCPSDDWVFDNANCYYLIPGGTNFADGVKTCHTMNAEVAIPESSSENAFLLGQIGSSDLLLGLKYDSASTSWVTAYHETPIYLGWGGDLPTGAAGDCIYDSNSNKNWQTTSCASELRMLCRKSATVDWGVLDVGAGDDGAAGGGDGPGDGGGGGDPVVGVSQPPASVNGAAGGLLSVPVNGELILYHQFLDPSTGVESAYQFPKLTFVEATEEIHRAGLVSFTCHLPLLIPLLPFLVAYSRKLSV